MIETVRGEAELDAGATRVRRAEAHDLPIVLSLRLALLREYADHPVYGQLHPDVESRAKPVFEQQIRAPDQAIFLAERDHEVAGIVRCADVKGSPLLLPERYCYVTSVYVRPDHRRHGVLGALMGQVEKWAKARGLTEMRLHNSSTSDAARFAWDQLGFAINEEVRHKRIR